MPSIRNCFKGNDKGMLKVKEYKPIYHANMIKENRSRPQRKKITRGGEGCSVMMKGSVHQEDIAILNLYVLNNRTE